MHDIQESPIGTAYLPGFRVANQSANHPNAPQQSGSILDSNLHIYKKSVLSNNSTVKQKGTNTQLNSHNTDLDLLCLSSKNDMIKEHEYSSADENQRKSNISRTEENYQSIRVTGQGVPSQHSSSQNNVGIRKSGETSPHNFGNDSAVERSSALMDQRGSQNPPSSMLDKGNELYAGDED